MAAPAVSELANGSKVERTTWDAEGFAPWAELSWERVACGATASTDGRVVEAYWLSN